MPPKVKVQPSFEVIEDIVANSDGSSKAPNVVPLYATIPADLLTPSLAYMKISSKSGSDYSFLFESAATTETIGRYSFLGSGPRKILKTGPGHGPAVDPMPLLAMELETYREAIVPGAGMPPLAGGAIGYVGYDCVRYFEPKTARSMKDIVGVPESLFMLYDTIVAFDHFYQQIKVISYLRLPSFSVSQKHPSDLSSEPPQKLDSLYQQTTAIIAATVATLLEPDIPLPPQPPIARNQPYTSNIGRAGYEAHVRTLKTHITRGDIIQAVPSQRFSRPTTVHPFNIYRHLRTVNPSPYLFFLSCTNFALVGASPELLVKVDPEDGRVITHPIAGTVKRGPTPQEDAALAESLANSIKDRAEHVMLVDLARNDVNRVCDPLETRVDRLMAVQKFSHVQHLVSQVSGVLRKDKTRFDAFRSIFPAGTVSGAPKVRAMELIAELEGEKRGVYAGAVGYFGYGGVEFVPPDAATGTGTGGNVWGEKGPTEAISKKGYTPVEREGAMDTCIALRTMLIKEGVAYLQAGGGIVFDSDPYDEWLETMNKLNANITCIEGAEERYAGVYGGEEGPPGDKGKSAGGEGTFAGFEGGGPDAARN